MRRMNVNRYLALQKIISLGSFSKAAEEMGYSQSATSQMIASLEKELGVSPIHRSRYGVTLTPVSYTHLWGNTKQQTWTG